MFVTGVDTEEAVVYDAQNMDRHATGLADISRAAEVSDAWERRTRGSIIAIAFIIIWIGDVVMLW